MGGQQLWRVVGGSKSGGLLVRQGQQLSSPELPDRLVVDAVVEQVKLNGERLHFQLKAGKGPATGWVSTRQKGNDLLVPFEPQPFPTHGAPADFGDDLVQIEGHEHSERLSWADAMCEVLPEYNFESPHKDDPEWKKERKQAFKAEFYETREKVGDEIGCWKALIPPPAIMSGPLHVLCVCCAETGHLTPILRIARACCNREAIGRVSFVTNTFGGSKVAQWLKNDPDPTNKLCLFSYEDGWTESLQAQCNWFAQEEDGSLLGISNMGIGRYSAACLQSILTIGDHPISCVIMDMASAGYKPILGAMAERPEVWRSKNVQHIISAPATILGAHIFEGWGPVLIHCFNSPTLAPLLVASKMALTTGVELGKGDPGAALDSSKSMDSTNIEEMMQKMMSGAFLADAALPENVIPVGIIADHALSQPLPKELTEFLERPGPVLYVSMGSVASFDAEQLARVCEGLKAPGEWRVIWSLRKSQQELLPPGGIKALGDDFLVSHWLPQAELLLHKKVVAFMSHCGWGATCEAILAAKPVIAFPMFADQNVNAMLMNLLGMAKTVGEEPIPTDPAQMQVASERMARSVNVSGRLRASFTADLLRSEIREVMASKTFLIGARRAKSMNAMFKGGAHKAAEEVEKVCTGESQALKAQATKG